MTRRAVALVSTALAVMAACGGDGAAGPARGRVATVVQDDLNNTYQLRTRN